MCLLKVKIKRGQEEQTYSEIVLIEVTDGILRLYNLLFEKVFEAPLSSIKRLLLNSVDANLLIDLE